MDQLWMVEARCFADTVTDEYKSLLAQMAAMEFEQLFPQLPSCAATAESNDNIGTLTKCDQDTTTKKDISFDSVIASKVENILTICEPSKQLPSIGKLPAFAARPELLSTPQKASGPKRPLNVSPGRSPAAKRLWMGISTAAAPTSPRMAAAPWLKADSPSKQHLSPLRKPLVDLNAENFGTPRLRNIYDIGSPIGSPIGCSTNPSKKEGVNLGKDLSYGNESPSRKTRPVVPSQLDRSLNTRQPFLELGSTGPKFSLNRTLDSLIDPAFARKVPANQFDAIPLISNKFGQKPNTVTIGPKQTQRQGSTVGLQRDLSEESIETLKPQTSGESWRAAPTGENARTWSELECTEISQGAKNSLRLPKSPSLNASSQLSTLATLPDMESGYSIYKDWAQTPVLAAQLREQALLDPSEIYSSMSPIKLEEVFRTTH